MKYYSKDPREFRHDRNEESKNEAVKKKKTYTLQLINIGILVAAIFLMIRTQGFMGGKKEKSRGDLNVPVSRITEWKGWAIKSECLYNKSCILTMINQGATLIPDAFSWEVKDRDTDQILIKAFELIPGKIKPHEEKKFTFSIENIKTDFNVELHFINNKNDEVLMMQVYP